MAWLPDHVLDRLREGSPPDFSGTRYSLVEPIGRGGMATVFKARDLALDREVAIKVLDPASLDGGLAARLLAEARVLARLEHPAIVPVHDAGELADGRAYSVMKLVRGRDLAGCADDLGGVPERLRLFERVCEAVAFAHAHGVIHRDLKPENVMVGPFGEVLVLDWGLAKWSGDLVADRPPAGGPAGEAASHTAHGAVLGTPGFMAPEQGAGEAVDTRADVYGLGALLAWLLGPARQGASQAAAVPRPLASIVERATARRPDDRYPSVLALVEDVRRYLDGLAVTAHQERALEKVARFARRHRVAIALLAAYLMMRVALLVFGRL